MRRPRPTTRTLQSKTLFVIDLDGVVYQGDRAVSGAVEALAQLKTRGRRVVFMTNNSGKTAADIAQKLAGLGVVCSASDVVSSGEAAVELIAQNGWARDGGVFVVGTERLRFLLRDRGLKICFHEPDADALLVGIDPQFNYDTLAMAATVARTQAPFIICNRDACYPIGNGRFLPGAGPIVAAIEAASERKADYEVGKPNPFIFQLLLRKTGANPQDCVIVGDGIESDLQLAKNMDVTSILISGVPAPVPGLLPDYQYSSLDEVVEALRAYPEDTNNN